jgi:multiple sugar transport system permease protein
MDIKLEERLGFERWSIQKERLFEFLSRRYVFIALTVLPTALLFAFINLLPIGWAIYASVFEIPLLSPDWQFIGIEHYVEILSDPAFWTVVQRSVVFAGGSVALQLVAGTGFALLLNRKFKFEYVIRALVLLPYTIPTAVLGFMALWMMNSQWGIINQILVQLGLLQNAIPWFANPDLAMIAVIVTNSWKFSIFVTIMVLARLQSIPDGYYEAAELAGANAYQRFRDITLPNLKGVIFIVLLLRGVWMFNKFDIIWVLTNGGPGQRTETASIYAFRTALFENNLGKAATISTILFVMLVVAALIYFAVLKPEEEVQVE